MSYCNLFELQTAEAFDKSEGHRGTSIGERPIAGINTQSNEKIINIGTAITEFSRRGEIAKSPLLRDPCTGAPANVQTKMFSRFKSAKNNLTNLFKMTSRTSSIIPSFDPFASLRIRQRCVPFPPLTPVTQRDIRKVCFVSVLDSFPSARTGSEVISSLVTRGKEAVEEHFDDDDDFSILRCAAGAQPPTLLALPLTLPPPRRIPPFTFPLSELPTIEEEVGNPTIDGEDLLMKLEKPVASSSRGSLTSHSDATYDAMLEAEFANFSFDSDDIQDWSDEVEREKQAKLDAHFAYVSAALAVPVPKLSAYFTVDENKFVSCPSPVKTDISEANVSSADFSLVTSVDAEEDQPQLSPIILHGLCRVRNYEDLRNLRVMADIGDSFSDLSFDIDASDLTAAECKTGTLHRSMKCNDLRRSFMLLESGIHSTYMS